ncbi:MAG: response regulator transcription factor [Deltaproteobacteria bacterium]|nr:MAG: response regulator transcription factor [Deltaproteobacteria bacterium]
MPAQTEKLEILVVEDELAIQRGLCDALAFHGYAPQGVGSGEDGLREGLGGRYALVILDLMLPGISGFDVCRQLRAARAELPILMLTARGSEEDVLRGFEAGSDDYVTKPFSVAQLLARVDALLRRAGRGAAAHSERFAFGEWELDPAALVARRGETRVDVTPREVEILALLAREEGRIVSRRMLLQTVWGFASPEKIETRTVDMHIAKLRRKIGADGDSPIETVRGAGYRYAGRG